MKYDLMHTEGGLSKAQRLRITRSTSLYCVCVLRLEKGYVYSAP